jgi:hypothetical protein
LVKRLINTIVGFAVIDKRLGDVLERLTLGAPGVFTVSFRILASPIHRLRIVLCPSDSVPFISFRVPVVLVAVGE